MTAQPSPKLSKNWPTKLLTIGGVLVALWLLLTILLPALVRSNRGVITRELSQIKQLPDMQQQAAYQRLMRATGQDQQAVRALADWYRQHLAYREAGEAYLSAKPALRVEASQAFADGYDFSRVFKTLTNPLHIEKGSEAQALIAQARINTDELEKGCDLAKELVQTDAQNGRAQNLVRACATLAQAQPPQTNLYLSIGQGTPLPVRDRIQKQNVKAASDWLVLASIDQRQGQTDQMVQHLASAYETDSTDRSELESIEQALRGVSSPAARDLRQKTQARLTLLPKY